MEEVIPFDWGRMLYGNAPNLFYLEILFRTLVIWTWAMMLLRWLGGRSISQLSLVEFLLVIALGSAVGDSLFMPDIPLLHAMLVIFLIIGLDRLIDLAVLRWPSVKMTVDGQPVEVIREGVIACDGLTARHIGRQEVMELLRLKGVENLGSVRLAYLEPSGELSIFGQEAPRLGLPIVPPIELLPDPDPQPGVPQCCRNCGALKDNFYTDCPLCGSHETWHAELAPRLKPPV